MNTLSTEQQEINKLKKVNEKLKEENENFINKRKDIKKIDTSYSEEDCIMSNNMVPKSKLPPWMELARLSEYVLIHHQNIIKSIIIKE